MSPDHRTPPDPPGLYRQTVSRLAHHEAQTRKVRNAAADIYHRALAQPSTLDAIDTAERVYNRAVSEHHAAQWALDAYKTEQRRAHAYARAKASMIAIAKRAYVARKKAAP